MIATLPKATARRLWIQAQRLDVREPFGSGPEATRLAVEHLGYVQIDTIHVIERCHHHILFNRIPRYRREDLHLAQARDKSVFEYWTHALAYVPTRDFRHFVREMREHRRSPGSWFRDVSPRDSRKVMRLVRDGGPISIREISDDVLVEKTHAWASRKPSRKALQLAFFEGRLVVSERVGMVKKYELTERHFGWPRLPRAAAANETLDYLIDRSLRSQALVSLDSICHLDAGRKGAIARRIEARARRGELREARIEGSKTPYWIRPELLDARQPEETELVHLLSPFDPLVIQRKRLAAFFDYEHRFEAYLPKEKRVFGYFALPALVGDRVAAAIDLKTDRERGRLLIRKWSWIGKERSRETKRRIEEELGRFEGFQLGPVRTSRSR